MEPRRVYIQNFGCQMNEYDAARMVEVLRREGYESAGSPEQADLIEAFSDIAGGVAA